MRGVPRSYMNTFPLYELITHELELMANFAILITLKTTNMCVYIYMYVIW